MVRFGGQFCAHNEFGTTGLRHVRFRGDPYSTRHSWYCFNCRHGCRCECFDIFSYKRGAEGKKPAKSHSGRFERALLTITDANVTTFFVAIILLSIGSGPVKGFAVTLAVGIVTSMFSSILVTRALVNLMYGNRNLQALTI